MGMGGEVILQLVQYHFLEQVCDKMAFMESKFHK